MLKMIRCDKFMCDGQMRDPIIFHDGLNVVLGNKKNSIGKSTLLMIIDYCFGGLDYYQKEKDTRDELGDHRIEFMFEFNGEKKYFARWCDKDNGSPRTNQVIVCDENFNDQRIISLETFNKELKKYYGIQDDDLSFRAVVGRFFRIYNRNTHNELRPLNAVLQEGERNGIVTLMRLYNLYSNLGNFEGEYDTAKDRKREYDNLKRFGVAEIAKDQAEYDRNAKEIEELRKKLQELIEDNELGVSSQEIILSGKKNELKSNKAKLVRLRDTLLAEISDIEFDSENGIKSFVRDYEKLAYFFPGIELKPIEDLEKFHKGVKNIIEKQTKEANDEKQHLIAMLNVQIEELAKQLKELKSVPNIKKEVVDRYRELENKIQKLEEANKNFDLRKQAETEFKEVSKKYESSIYSTATSLQNRINTSMQEYQTRIGENKKAPVLSLNGLASYSFYTPKDTGTGTRNKGVCLFDLTVLNQTSLPAFVHDTVMFQSVEPHRLDKLIEFYKEQTGKQIFISFDDLARVSDETKQVLFDDHYKVIYLQENAKALFGREWNTEE